MSRSVLTASIVAFIIGVAVGVLGLLLVGGAYRVGSMGRGLLYRTNIFTGETYWAAASGEWELIREPQPEPEVITEEEARRLGLKRLTMEEFMALEATSAPADE